MTETALKLTKCILTQMWAFATSWKLPGINLTPAQCIMFILMFGTVLRFAFSLLNFSVMEFGHEEQPSWKTHVMTSDGWKKR